MAPLLSLTVKLYFRAFPPKVMIFPCNRIRRYVAQVCKRSFEILVVNYFINNPLEVDNTLRNTEYTAKLTGYCRLIGNRWFALCKSNALYTD